MLQHGGMGGDEFSLELDRLFVSRDRLLVALLGFEEIGKLLETRAESFGKKRPVGVRLGKSPEDGDC